MEVKNLTTKLTTKWY